MSDAQIRRDEEKRKGLIAHSILDNEVFAEAVSRLSEECVERWRLAQTPEERDREWHRAQALDEIVGELRGLVESGKVAAARRH